MASLTNSGSSTVERTLDTDVILQQTDDLEANYELSRCVSWIVTGRYEKVCLQFPDELLADAAPVARTLTQRLGFSVYILGDTSYGSCCVDEVAAEHVGADAVIHFGRTCLSPSRRIPVLYILTRIHVDVPAVVSGLCTAIEDSSSKLIFVYDTRCHYISETIITKLQEKFSHLLSTVLNENYKKDHQTKESLSDEGSHETSKDVNSLTKVTDICDNSKEEPGNLVFNGRLVVLPSDTNIKDYQFVYLGPDGPTLTSMLLRFSENVFHCINPSDGKVKTSSGVRTVMSRSGKLEMAKDAEIIGILIGTLGVADYCDVIARLKRLIKNAGKRSYTFVVGKPNEPKLCNIAEVDVFVYVSCPETAIVERQTDPALYKKLITPWELEVALLAGQEWSLEFESDFRQLLPGGRKHVEMTNTPLDEQVNVSLLTSKTQRLGVRDATEEALDSTTGAVVLQNGLTIAELHVGGAGELLKNRTWQGLDASVAAPSPIGHVAEGRSGIASVYQDENKVDNS